MMNNKILTWAKRITLIALSVAFVVSAGLVVLSHRASWDAYYKDMLAKKELFDKSQEPEVTVMNGIRVTVKDGVGFFNNGKALAVKENFVVEGLYTIGNEIEKRDYEEEIVATDYTLTAPEDFTQNGGELVFNYRLTEVVKDENGDVVKEDDGNGNMVDKINVIYDFTQTLTIELVEVKLESLRVTTNPYIVSYAEGDVFKAEGMTVDAVYNDGTVIEDLSLGLLTLPTEALTLGAENAKIEYRYGEGEEDVIYGFVPVTVQNKDSFTNGELERLSIVGDVSLSVGATASSVKPEVYGYYSSGNYVKLDESQYKVSGFKGEAEFGKKYSLVITSAENTDVSTRISLYPVISMAADEAVLNGATAYDGFVKDFDGGDYIEFTYNAATSGVVDFYVNMSNGYIAYENGSFVSKKISLGDFAYVQFNGKIRMLSHSFKGVGPFAYSSDALSSYEKVYLGSFSVKAGSNVLRLCFKDCANGLTSAYGGYVAGAIKDLEISSQTASSAYATFGEYVEESVAANTTPSYVITQELGWKYFAGGYNASWVYASATDGEYLFFYVNSANGAAAGAECAYIAKYDLEKKQIVATTSRFDFALETYATLFVRDSYVYTRAADGTFMRVPASFTGSGTAKMEYVPNLVFKNDNGESLNAQIRTAYYNHSLRRYAILNSSASVTITDASGKQVNSFTVRGGVTANKVTSGTGTASLARITGDENYIYATYKTNGVVNPVTAIYNWEGVEIKTIYPAVESSVTGVTHDSCNIQSAVALDGSIYFTLLRWVVGNDSSVYKMSATGVASEGTATQTMDLYEYVAACEEKGVTPAYTKTLVGNGVLPTSDMYNHGICTDGTYIYVTANTVQNSDKGLARITKRDPATGKVVGITATFDRGGNPYQNGDYMTYANGYVYVILQSGAVKRIKTSSITSDGTATVEDYDFKVDGLSGTKSAITYNSFIQKYAILAGGQLNIVGGGSMKVEKTISAGAAKSMGVASDANYIYVFDEKNNEYGSALMHVFDWSGNLVKNGVVVPNLISEKTNNNVQSMCVVNGEYYFLVTFWGSGAKLVKVGFDLSVIR